MLYVYTCIKVNKNYFELVDSFFYLLFPCIDVTGENLDKDPRFLNISAYNEIRIIYFSLVSK